MKKVVALAELANRTHLKSVFIGFDLPEGEKISESTHAAYFLVKDGRELYRFMIGAESTNKQFEFSALVINPGRLELIGEWIAGPKKLGGHFVWGDEL